MTLPSFLIIGAMKAGTTSLFRDLRHNPAIFMPSDKELNNLNNDEVFSEMGRSEYEAIFKNATQSQICGEASTAYTKLPDIQGVPKRACDLLGSDLRVIYLVRNPIGRLISQYHHSVIVSGLKLQIDDAVFNHAPLVNYSKYAMQITPWIKQFGSDRVRILVMEEYVENRASTIESICGFLEVPSNADKVQEERTVFKSCQEWVLPETDSSPFPTFNEGLPSQYVVAKGAGKSKTKSRVNSMGARTVAGRHGTIHSPAWNK